MSTYTTSTHKIRNIFVGALAAAVVGWMTLILAFIVLVAAIV